MRRRQEPGAHDWLMPPKRSIGKGTSCVHAGSRVDPQTGAVVAPIYQASTFSPASAKASGGDASWFYTRYANPSVVEAEEKIAQLEGAEGSRVFSSGMAAMAASVFSNANAGQEVVALAGVYGGTQVLLRQEAPRLGLKVRWVEHAAAEAVLDAVTPETRVVVVETPTNPLNRVLDLERLSRGLASRFGRDRPSLVVDATFATPLNLQPLAMGASVSMHSATKYLNGHSDVVAGVASANGSAVQALDGYRRVHGANADPHQAFLLSRGLKTLHLRLRAAEANAAALAEALERSRKVSRVWFLGSKSHPDYRLGRRVLRGPGAVLAFELGNQRASAATRFMSALSWFTRAPSLGGIESLVGCPWTSSHAGLSAAQRRRQGIQPSTIRLAVGIEDPDDLLADVRRGLKAI